MQASASAASLVESRRALDLLDARIAAVHDESSKASLRWHQAADDAEAAHQHRNTDPPVDGVPREWAASMAHSVSESELLRARGAVAARRSRSSAALLPTSSRDNPETQRFLGAFRSHVYAIKAVSRVQSLWRMRRKRKRLVRWRRRREVRLLRHLKAWRATCAARLFFDRQLLKWIMREWVAVADVAARTRDISRTLFERRLGNPKLCITVRVRRPSRRCRCRRGRPPTPPRSPSAPPPPPPQAVNLFFDEDAVFADEGMGTAVRVGVRRQICRILYDSWCRVLVRRKRARVEASVHLQRAQSLDTRASHRWPAELVCLTFHMWRRMIAYRKAIKAAEPPPLYELPVLAEWEVWVHKFTLRRLLKRKVARMGRVNFIKARLRRWKW